MGGVQPEDFVVIQGLTVITTLLWVFRLWIGEARELFWPPVCWAVAGFVIYAVFRYQQADIEYVARREWIRIVVYCLLFFAVVNNLPRTDSARVISLSLVLLGVGLSLFAVYQFVTHSGKIWSFIKPAGYLSRGSGTFINPNHLAGFLEMVAPLGLSWALMGRQGHAVRILVGYGTVITLIGIGVSGSRGGWIATGFMLLVFLAVLCSRPRHRLLAAAAFVVIILASLYCLIRFLKPSPRIEYSIASGQFADIRQDIWRVAWRMWSDHPWLGVGPGHFDSCYTEYRPALVQLQDSPLYAHNDYLNTLADWGLIGALIISAAWLLVWLSVWRIWRHLRRSLPDGRSNKLALLLGGASGLFAISLHSLTDFNMQVPSNAILAVIIMALLSGQMRVVTDTSRLNLTIIGRVLASLVLLGGALYLGAQGWFGARETRWLQRAEERNQDLSTKKEVLKKAFAVEPMNSDTAYRIGEIYRAQSWAGNSDYREQAEQAMTWIQRAAALNRHGALNPARLGMCLDWLGRTNEAGVYFEQAHRLDANGYYMLMLQGWHRMQLREYAAAKTWFERSLALRWARDNPAAAMYLEIANRKLAEASASPKR